MVALAVMGGWLAVMPHAVLTVALRMREFDPSGLPALYSAALAAGWLVLIAALVAFGIAGDALARRGRRRVILLLAASPAMAAAGLALALAPSPGLLALAWLLAQVPAAAAIATSLALGGTATPAPRRGLLSASVGAAPILALLVGGSLVRLLEGRPSWAFAIAAIVGALLLVPLAVWSPAERAGEPPGDRRASGAASRRLAPAWVAFAIASFLLSTATSATNGYVVLFIERVAAVPATEVASLASTTVAGAALVAVAASLASALVVRGRTSGATLWSSAALVVALAVVALLAQPGATAVLAGAAAFGIGFGMANGAELGVLLFLRHRPGRLGRDLGIFTAVTTLPYVLVPAVGSVVLESNAPVGLRLLLGTSAALAIVAGLIVAAIAVRSPRAPG